MADAPTSDTQPTGPRPLLTIRVSRDNGATYGPTAYTWPDDPLPPLTHLIWPPCQCPRHRGGGGPPVPWTA